jgi:uncharacterized membrane protein YeaQ/YmgE (transglycosylase-associated protein family)
MGIIWTIIIGFLAGLIARWIHPGVSNEPSGRVEQKRNLKHVSKRTML